MGFNSFEFFFFLPFVFFLFWFLNPNRKAQNWLLLLASYLFYGWWDYRFLGLIFLSSIVDFVLGKQIFKAVKTENKKKAKQILNLSLIVNLGLLCVFKYYNFFVVSFVEAFQFVGIPLHIQTLKIILPVGISFYTFQTLSYTFDIYRERIKPTEDWVAFFTFVAFFPQLVAGPIERAAKMLPQFKKKVKFEYTDAVEGMRFILIGLFKKIVIADYCARHVDELFSNYTQFGGSDLFIGIFFFFFMQLYADFSAYSEIAIGTARLFGIKLSKNFAFPAYTRNIEEFWQRWHITLGRWFRDYLYLGLHRSPIGRIGKNWMLMLMFTAIGLWHGARWTYVIWGICNGLMFLYYLRFQKPYLKYDSREPAQLKHIPNILGFYLVFNMYLVFFRAGDIATSIGYFKGIFSLSFFSVPTKWPFMFWPMVLLIWEWQFRDKWHALQVHSWSLIARRSLYLLMIIIMLHHFGLETDFFYFQF